MAAYNVVRLGNRKGLIQPTTEERAVTNAAKVTESDFVELAQGGRVGPTDGSGKLYGIVAGGSNDDLVSRNHRTPEVTGDANGTKKVLVELVEGERYELPVNASLASDAEGSYYNLTGATGAQLVANASKSATVGQLLCLKRIPTNAAGTEFTRGIFTVAAVQSAAAPA